MYNFHRTRLILRVTNRNEAEDASKHARKQIDIWRISMIKKTTLAGQRIARDTFCSFGPGRHRYREHNQSYLSVQRNVLRWWLSYESALNASSNEINMPDGNFRVIYGHGRNTENLREFVRNFSTSNSSREVTIALTDLD